MLSDCHVSLFGRLNSHLFSFNLFQQDCHGYRVSGWSRAIHDYSEFQSNGLYIMLSIGIHDAVAHSALYEVAFSAATVAKQLYVWGLSILFVRERVSNRPKQGLGQIAYPSPFPNANVIKSHRMNVNEHSTFIFGI